MDLMLPNIERELSQNLVNNPCKIVNEFFKNRKLNFTL